MILVSFEEHKHFVLKRTAALPYSLLVFFTSEQLLWSMKYITRKHLPVQY